MPKAAFQNDGQIIDSLIADYTQTCEEKEKRIEEKKFALVANIFCLHAYSIDLIGHLVERVNREDKSHALGRISIF